MEHGREKSAKKTPMGGDASPQAEGLGALPQFLPPSKEAVIDLHGMSEAQALTAVDGFMLKCSQIGALTGCIIHGKGNGYLRDRIHGLINAYYGSYVKNFRVDANNPGQTIIEFFID